jgi:hypothetical protein
MANGRSVHGLHYPSGICCAAVLCVNSQWGLDPRHKCTLCNKIVHMLCDVEDRDDGKVVCVKCSPPIGLSRSLDQAVAVLLINLFLSVVLYIKALQVGLKRQNPPVTIKIKSTLPPCPNFCCSIHCPPSRTYRCSFGCSSSHCIHKGRCGRRPEVQSGKSDGRPKKESRR